MPPPTLTAPIPSPPLAAEPPPPPSPSGDVEEAMMAVVERSHTLFDPGTRVEVRTSFEERWGRGFEVAETLEDGYRIRRLSDGEVLPLVFEPHTVRKERRRGNWWY